MLLDATAPHTRIDNFVIDDFSEKIGAYGLAVYTVIKRHYNWATGQCTPSYNRIAEMIKASRSTVIRTVKVLKKEGLIDPQLRFTDEGQTSNQYSFYQPKRPTPAQKRIPVQPSTPTQPSTTAHICPPVSQGHPPGVCETPDQVELNKKEEKKENAKPMPKEEKSQLLKEKKEGLMPGAESSVPAKKTAAMEKTEKQQACPHPAAEVVRLTGGITVCNHCYAMLEFLTDTQAA